MTSLLFHIHGRPFNIAVPYTNNRLGEVLIITDEYREVNSLAYPLKVDFVEDIRYMLSILETTPLTGKDDYAFALSAMCEQHVREFGRIIDTDLFTYIDELLLIMKHLGKLEGADITFEIGNTFWEYFKAITIEAFTQELWLNVPTLPFNHNPLESSMKLVKYTEYYL